MNDLRSLEFYVLLDMLVKYTIDYTDMYHVGVPSREEFEKCKLTIKAIQKEIYSRREAALKSNSNESTFILTGDN